MATLQEAAKTLPGFPIVQGRVKEFGSFAEKCQRKYDKYKQPAWQLTDLCGVRVLVVSKDAIEPFRKFIEETFQISENEDKARLLKEMEFGYQSIHFIVSLDKEKKHLYKLPEGISEIPEELTSTRTGEEALGTSLPIGPKFKAEIQLRTLLQHAWSESIHDKFYKAEIKKMPKYLSRESARIAALLEDADDAFVRLSKGVDEYRSYYGAYMTPEEIMDEIELQRIILSYDPDNRATAVKIARLADNLGDDTEEISSVEQDLSPFEQKDYADIQRELGMVRWKAGNKEKESRVCLNKATELNDKDPDAFCELGRTYFEENKYAEALVYYEKPSKQIRNILEPCCAVSNAGSWMAETSVSFP